ncbi:MAG TPA: maleylpyruvate isomerase N-terminal domain-containing protein [Chloroflexota bacterium]|jgi:uncharacterized protein (TIGR03083 family)
MASASTTREFVPDNLLHAAAAACNALAPARDADWSVLARDLEWTCHRTLQHMAEAPLFHATHLATRATARRPSLRAGETPPPVADLLQLIPADAAILADVARAAPPDARGWHATGMADASGFAAISCVELLIHTDDIAQALGIPYRPPDDLARRIVGRLCPWAPAGHDGWATLQWAAGRAALPDHPRLGADWAWQSAPLSEWDGTVKKRRPA